MSFRFNSIKLKLTVFYSVVLVIFLVIFHLLAYVLLSYGLFNNLDDSLAADFSKARDAILQSGNDDLSGLLDELNGSSDGSVFIYDVGSKEIIGNPAAVEDIRTTLSGIITLGSSDFSQQLNTPDGRIRLYFAALEPTTETDRLLGVTRSADYIYRALDEYRSILLISLPFVLLFAAVSGYLLANNSLKPINVIARTAKGIDPANLRDRIEVKGSDELGRLSKTLNSLFDRIHGFIDRQRQFTADASHDLRAPLAVIKAETSLALRKKRTLTDYRSSLEIINRETERLNSLVDDLLTLASMDSSLERAKTYSIDLSSLTEGILNGWEAPYIQKGVKLNRQISPGIEIFGETLHFSRIVDNLLENAIEFTPEGGSVICSLADEGNEIILTVADTGIGIANGHLESIFNRFYKVNRSARGNGLGLPIVEDTVKMYGGRITMESEPGKGSVFRVFMLKTRTQL